MWILHFLPDTFLLWFINAILLVGLSATVISFFLKYFPLLIPYATLIKFCGIVLLILGVWLRGGYDVEMSWRQKASEMQAKIDLLDKQLKETNKKLDEKLSNNRNVIKDKVNENSKAIQSNKNSIDAECRVNDTAWMLYNRAVENKVSRSSSTNVGTSTGTKASTSR